MQNARRMKSILFILCLTAVLLLVSLEGCANNKGPGETFEAKLQRVDSQLQQGLRATYKQGSSEEILSEEQEMEADDNRWRELYEGKQAAFQEQAKAYSSATEELRKLTPPDDSSEGYQFYANELELMEEYSACGVDEYSLGLEKGLRLVDLFTINDPEFLSIYEQSKNITNQINSIPGDKVRSFCDEYYITYPLDI